LAEPGGVCIARVVRDQIRDKLPYPFADIGEQGVKNIARPVRAYAMSAAAIAATPLVAAPARPSSSRRSVRRALIATGAFTAIAVAILVWWNWPQGSTSAIAVPKVSPQSAPAVATPSVPRLSIVVLPFANLSNDPGQEYFADGITDDLTTDLSRISGSFVIARNTAFTYKGKAVEAKQIGRELGTRYVLEGSVRRIGEQIR
jgi:adenylate cyclase